jgi:hypothetical protein
MKACTKRQRVFLIITALTLTVYLYSFAPWHSYRRVLVKSQQEEMRHEWVHVASPRLGLGFKHEYWSMTLGWPDKGLDHRSELALGQTALETVAILVICLLIVVGCSARGGLPNSKTG